MAQSGRSLGSKPERYSDGKSGFPPRRTPRARCNRAKDFTWRYSEAAVQGSGGCELAVVWIQSVFSQILLCHNDAVRGSFLSPPTAAYYSPWPSNKRPQKEYCREYKGQSQVSNVKSVLKVTVTLPQVGGYNQNRRQRSGGRSLTLWKEAFERVWFQSSYRPYLNKDCTVD